MSGMDFGNSPAKQLKGSGLGPTPTENPELSKYYYKIDGKPVTKKQYIKHKHEPGNMEGGGKQTNDPDVYGRKANNHGRGPKTK